MKAIRFAFYAAVFIVLTSFLLNFIDANYGEFSLPEQENPNSPYQWKVEVKYANINVTLEDLNSTRDSWLFTTANFSESPVILREGGNKPLKEALLEVLSRNATDVTMEQYAIAGKALSLFTLRGNGDFVEYPILLPYGSFVLRLEKTDYDVVNVTFPPSADILISGPAQRLEDYVTVTSKTTCGEYRIEDTGVVVDILYRVYFDSQVVSESKWIEVLGIPRMDVGECRITSEGCTGEDNYCIRLTVCKEENGYSVKKPYCWFKESGFKGQRVRFTAFFVGYHGENTLNLTARCVHSYEVGWNRYDKPSTLFYFTSVHRVQIAKQNWKWTGSLTVPVAKEQTTLSTVSCCYFSVEDTLKTPIGDIERSFGSGSFWYYYRPYYCDPYCHDEYEDWDVRGVSAPEHVKKPFGYDPENKTIQEKLILIDYSEAIKAKAEKNATRNVELIREQGLWEKFFFEDSFENASRAVLYFLLSQIPLGVKPNETMNLSPLQTFLKGEGNCSAIFELGVFFENVTVDIGETNFVQDYVKTDCGRFAVAELAYYRQPGLNSYSSIYTPPKEFMTKKGYEVPGIEFRKEERVCKVVQ